MNHHHHLQMMRDSLQECINFLEIVKNSDSGISSSAVGLLMAATILSKGTKLEKDLFMQLCEGVFDRIDFIFKKIEESDEK